MNLNIDSDTLCNSLCFSSFLFNRIFIATIFSMSKNGAKSDFFKYTQIVNKFWASSFFTPLHQIVKSGVQLIINLALAFWCVSRWFFEPIFGFTARQIMHCCFFVLRVFNWVSLIVDITMGMSINILRFLHTFFHNIINWSSINGRASKQASEREKRTAEIRFFPDFFLIVNWEFPHHHK